MSNTKDSQRDYLRRAIIAALLKAGAGVFEFFTLPLTVRYKGSRLLTKAQVHKIVNKLIYEGELIRTKDDRYQFTAFGTTRILPFIHPILARDGNLRILVFDVPESERRRRDCFRHHIRFLGFTLHQRSVWVSKFKCEDWIDRLVDYHKMGDWVSLYIGKQVY
ncbi:MAG: hypothetical protein WC553_00135 [Patescibacteria group bacterium]|jgi:DNA-binding transcriptional regulator PaaX